MSIKRFERDAMTFANDGALRMRAILSVSDLRSSGGVLQVDFAVGDLPGGLKWLGV